MRSFLRQDPNIILVGEVRDFETAEVAIKAAMTGHLGASPPCIPTTRPVIDHIDCMNMGIEPFLVATSCPPRLAAQRLAAPDLPASARSRPAFPTDEQVLIDIGFSEDEIAEVGQALQAVQGCEVCNNTGYKGRVALYEVMPFKDRLREIVLQGGSTAEVKDEMIRDGVSTLRMAGLNKVLQGVTTIDEIVRVTAADN